MSCCLLICGPQVQLSETRRELQELKASLRVAQKEKEQHHAEKQVRKLESILPEQEKKNNILRFVSSCVYTARKAQMLTL